MGPHRGPGVRDAAGGWLLLTELVVTIKASKKTLARLKRFAEESLVGYQKTLNDAIEMLLDEHDKAGSQRR